MSISSDIQALYIAYFNRPADALGLQYWTAQANANGGSVAAVANAFSASTEYTDLFAGKSTADIINTIYQNLFGRPAEAAGILFWGGALDNGTLNIGNIATQIEQGAQNDDKIAIANKVIAAGDFTAALTTGELISGYSGTAANAVASAWLKGVTDTDSLNAAIAAGNLNTVLNNVVAAHADQTATHTSLVFGIDNLVGTSGNDVFSANLANDPLTHDVVSTLETGDTIDGGAGTDTLNVYVPAGGTLATDATVTNVEIINISDKDAQAIDISSWTGVQTVNLSGFVGTDQSLTSTASTVSIGAGAKEIVIDGSTKLDQLKTVSLSGYTDASSITGKAVSTVTLADSDAQTVTITNAAATHKAALTLNVSGLTGASTVVDADDEYSSATVTATGKSTVALNKGTVASALASVTLGGSAALDFSTDSTVLKTVTITGSGGVTTDVSAIIAGGSVDASASTGDNVVTLDGTVATFVGGAGDDTVILAAAPSKSIDGGTGANTLDFDGALVDLSLLTKAALANAVNFQTLALSGAVGTLGSTLDVSALGSAYTGVTVNTHTDAAALTFSKVASGFNFTELDSQAKSSIITLKTDGKADVVNLTLGDAKSVALTNTITTTTFETVNVTAHADVSDASVQHVLALIDADATTLTVTGEAGVDFTGSTLTKVATVSAGTATGDITIDLSAGVTAGVTVTTGTGDDTITTAGAADKIDTINTGTGSDTVTVGAGDNSITMGGGTKAVETVSVGDGANTVHIGDAGTIAITAGDGDNIVTVGAGDATATFGAGDNTLTFGNGKEIVTVGDGNNTITVGNGVDTITVGAGNNTIVAGSGVDTVHLGVGANVVTLGGGNDIVVFDHASQSSGVFSTIKDIAAGDVLDFSNLSGAINTAGKLGAAVTIGTNDYQTFLNQAVHSQVAGTVSWFQFGGDTYVVEEGGTTGSFVAGTDHVVKLTGIHDLSNSVIDAGHTTLTIV
jgi:S-layer protein